MMDSQGGRNQRVGLGAEARTFAPGATNTRAVTVLRCLSDYF